MSHSQLCFEASPLPYLLLQVVENLLSYCFQTFLDKSMSIEFPEMLAEIITNQIPKYSNGKMTALLRKAALKKVEFIAFTVQTYQLVLQMFCRSFCLSCLFSIRTTCGLQRAKTWQQKQMSHHFSVTGKQTVMCIGWCITETRTVSGDMSTIREGPHLNHQCPKSM